MMTPEETLIAIHKKYPGQYGTLCIEEWQIEAMKEYARLQIEKDRERVINEVVKWQEHD